MGSFLKIKGWGMTVRPPKIKNTLRIPRLVIDGGEGKTGERLALTAEAAHYLKHVMRLNTGDKVHLVIADIGLFEAELDVQRKDVYATVGEQLEVAPVAAHRICLIFSPIKQQKMHFLIEKSVELGVTELWPVLMDHSAVRDVNVTRVEAVVREAMEQSERLTRPHVHPLETLAGLLKAWPAGVPLYALLERAPENTAFFTALLADGVQDVGVMVGPEGGFSVGERALLTEAAQKGQVQLVSLGTQILRAETAALAALSLIYLR